MPCSSRNSQQDERFSTHVPRGENQAELDQIISDWSKQSTADALLELLEQHAVPAGRIYRAPEMLKDEHFIARESIVDVGHPEYESLKMQNVFPRLSATPGSIKWTGPGLGQHNEEIYRGLLGYSASDLERLRRDGIV